jgi:ethanolamine ammonia-lyase large subunit
MGVPGADDVMLGYQSTSFHDVLYLREALGLRPAPEFEAWLETMGILEGGARLARHGGSNPLVRSAAGLLEGATGEQEG